MHTKKVVIVGAGPSGLLLAFYLLRRDEQYQVEIYEKRNDPRTIPFSKARTFPISLNERGMAALRKIEGVEEAVKAISLEMGGTIFHQKNGKARLTRRKKALITLDRTKLVIVILEKITECYNNNRLKVYFNHQCTKADFTAKKVSFKDFLGTKFTVDYDLLIGADGAYSAIREYFLSKDGFECEQKYVLNDYKSIFLPQPDENLPFQLEKGKIHSWIDDNNTLIVLLHLIDGTMGGVILFPHNQSQVTSLNSKQEVRKFFADNFSEVNQLMPEEELEAFLNRPTSRIATIRCNRYHFSDSVLLIGDAAHAVSSSIGQGCNAALEDVVLFDNLLNEYSDNLAQVLEQFTTRRLHDAHALVELGDNAFPSSKNLLIEFVLREATINFLHELFPKRFSASLSELIFETTVPYTEILNQYNGWISKVKKSNEKLVAR